MGRKTLLYWLIVAGLFTAMGFVIAHQNPTGPKKEKIVSYDGTYHSVEKLEFTATIENDEIEILWVTDGTSGLYWSGTFPGGTGSIISAGNISKMAGSLYGSQDRAKRFTLVDGRNIVFTFMAMESSHRVVLWKD